MSDWGRLVFAFTDVFPRSTVVVLTSLRTEEVRRITGGVRRSPAWIHEMLTEMGDAGELDEGEAYR